MIYFLQSESRGWYLVGTAAGVAQWLDSLFSCAGRLDRRNRQARRVRRESPFRVAAQLAGDEGRLLEIGADLAGRGCQVKGQLPDVPVFWVAPGPEIAVFLAEHGQSWDGEDAALLGVKPPERARVERDTPKPPVDIRGRLARRHHG